MIARYLAGWRGLPRAQLAMVLVLAVAIVFANVDQPFPEIAPLQHAPTVLLILAAPPLLARWQLSNRAVGAILVFLLLHTLAGRWTYSNVPYDAWAKALTGHTISAMFGLHRNDFDRIVHLSFGMLMVPAYAEFAGRHLGQRGGSAIWSAVLFVGCVSAGYEIFEWLLTIIVAPDMAADYNGEQGDVWDSQKDMAMALSGAVIIGVITEVRRRSRTRAD